MRVFRQIIVVGVGAAITFSNPGQSASAQPPAQSQDSLARFNPLELAAGCRSTSNTAPESVSDPEQSIALNPQTSESQQQGFANIASTPPTRPEQASEPQQAALAAPSTQQQESSAQPLRKPAPTDIAQGKPSNNPNNLPVPSAPVQILPGTPNESFPRITPRGILDTKPPASLEPNPNPLQFPTKPEDVRIEQTESITLQQGDRPRPPQQPSFANRRKASGTKQIRFARTASCSLSRPEFSNGRQPFCECRRRTRNPGCTAPPQLSG